MEEGRSVLVDGRGEWGRGALGQLQNLPGGVSDGKASGYLLGKEVQGQTWRSGTTRGGHRADERGVETARWLPGTGAQHFLKPLRAGAGFLSRLAGSALWEVGVQDRLEPSPRGCQAGGCKPVARFWLRGGRWETCPWGHKEQVQF